MGVVEKIGWVMILCFIGKSLGEGCEVGYVIIGIVVIRLFEFDMIFEIKVVG